MVEPITQRCAIMVMTARFALPHRRARMSSTAASPFCSGPFRPFVGTLRKRISAKTGLFLRAARRKPAPATRIHAPSTPIVRQARRSAPRRRACGIVQPGGDNIHPCSGNRARAMKFRNVNSASSARLLQVPPSSSGQTASMRQLDRRAGGVHRFFLKRCSIIGSDSREAPMAERAARSRLGWR